MREIIKVTYKTLLVESRQLAWAISHCIRQYCPDVALTFGRFHMHNYAPLAIFARSEIHIALLS